MTIILIPIVLLVAFLGVMGLVFWRLYQQVSPGQALVVNRTQGRTRVTFTGAMVLPILHRAEVMDISVKSLRVERRGADGLICRDGIRADVIVTFWIRVDPTEQGVLQVAQSIGCARASDPSTLQDLFIARFSEALKTVSIQLDFLDLYKKREMFKAQVLEVIGRDLNGYQVDDASIDFMEQTPIEALDPNNISDAKGIKKILELTEAGVALGPASTQAPIFDHKPPADPRPLLPAASPPQGELQFAARLGENNPVLMLATDPPVLSLRAETSPVCGIDLTAPLQSFVAADTDKGMLVLEFRQQQMGQTVRLLFKTEAQPLIDAASDSVLAQEAFAGLSRLSVPCPAVPSADAMRLLRSIRWVLRAHDNERWS